MKKKSTARRVEPPRRVARESISSPVKSVRSSGQRAKRLRSSDPVSYDVEDLARAVVPLLELFSMLDAVFTEDDALTINKQVSLGRCYEAWQTCRKAFDPDFVARDHRKPRGWKVKP